MKFTIIEKDRIVQHPFLATLLGSELNEFMAFEKKLRKFLVIEFLTHIRSALHFIHPIHSSQFIPTYLTARMHNLMLNFGMLLSDFPLCQNVPEIARQPLSGNLGRNLDSLIFSLPASSQDVDENEFANFLYKVNVFQEQNKLLKMHYTLISLSLENLPPHEECVQIVAEKLALISTPILTPSSGQPGGMIYAPNIVAWDWSRKVNIEYFRDRSSETLVFFSEWLDDLIGIIHGLTEPALLDKLMLKVIDHFQLDIRRLFSSIEKKLHILKNEGPSAFGSSAPLKFLGKFNSFFTHLGITNSRLDPTVKLYESIYDNLAACLNNETRKLTFLASYYKQQPSSAYAHSILSKRDGEKDLVKKIFSYV